MIRRTLLLEPTPDTPPQAAAVCFVTCSRTRSKQSRGGAAWSSMELSHLTWNIDLACLFRLDIWHPVSVRNLPSAKGLILSGTDSSPCNRACCIQIEHPKPVEVRTSQGLMAGHCCHSFKFRLILQSLHLKLRHPLHANLARTMLYNFEQFWPTPIASHLPTHPHSNSPRHTTTTKLPTNAHAHRAIPLCHRLQHANNKQFSPTALALIPASGRLGGSKLDNTFHLTEA